MIRIPCPFCGLRDHAEFTYEGDATRRLPGARRLGGRLVRGRLPAREPARAASRILAPPARLRRVPGRRARHGDPRHRRGAAGASRHGGDGGADERLSPAPGGRIDRGRNVTFTWDGTRHVGCPGDTVASALLAHGERVLARSFKYHRPRGVMTAGIEEGGALVTLGRGARAHPERQGDAGRDPRRAGGQRPERLALGPPRPDRGQQPAGPVLRRGLLLQDLLRRDRARHARVDVLRALHPPRRRHGHGAATGRTRTTTRSSTTIATCWSSARARPGSRRRRRRRRPGWTSCWPSRISSSAARSPPA